MIRGYPEYYLHFVEAYLFTGTLLSTRGSRDLVRSGGRFVAGPPCLKSSTFVVCMLSSCVHSTFRNQLLSSHAISAPLSNVTELLPAHGCSKCQTPNTEAEGMMIQVGGEKITFHGDDAFWPKTAVGQSLPAWKAFDVDSTYAKPLAPANVGLDITTITS